MPASKRQKRDHVRTSADQVEASFASESDSDSAIEDGHSGEGSDEDDRSTDDASGDEMDHLQGSATDTATGEPQALQHKTPNKSAARPKLDINNIALSAGSFKSNMFKLQMDEMLTGLRMKRGTREEAAEKALLALKSTIEQIQPIAPLPIDEAERRLFKSSKVAIPFPNPRPPRDAQYKLAFDPPAGMNVVGSYALKTGLRSRSDLTIDMSVDMPTPLFQEKDYLNHRYFYKRAYYLACIAAALKRSHSKEFEIRYQYCHDDPLKPILVIRPIPAENENGKDNLKEARARSSQSWSVHILPCTATDVVAPAKLSLSKNSVRGKGSEGDATQPTPFYNSSLRADMLLQSYLGLLHNSSKTCAAFKDACLLGTTWLRQRGFHASMAEGGFASFEWSTLMALSLKGGGPGDRPILSEGYSSYQLFKATLQLLAVKDFTKQALCIGSTGSEEFASDGEMPIVWDAERKHNVLYQVSPWSYRRLRNEAKTTLTMLGDQLYDGFETTFIQKADHPALCYDYVLQIPTKALTKSMNPDAGQLKEQCTRMYHTLKKGLGDRVLRLNLKLPMVGAWAVGSNKSHVPPTSSIFVGMVVNSDTVGRTVDHGPVAEKKAEAAAFREFWGEKAELRRFRNGSISESLVWTPSSDGQTVFEQIVRYLIRRTVGDQAERELHLRGDNLARVVKHNNAAATFLPINEAFKRLETDLRGLEFVLSIRQISPSDAQLRSASVAAPDANSISQRMTPADVVLQFEGSARWPDELVAIQRTKIAFLLLLSTSLQEAVADISCRIGLENEDQPALNQGFLVVTYDSGFSFRLRIHHDREQTLYQRQLKDKSEALDVKEIAAVGLAIYKRDYLHRPAHTQSIARLCSRFSALSGTIRVLKKWFACHLLGDHFAEELIELFAVRTFVQPWPWAAPSSVQTGFLRTLHWLARWDWRDDPLIVDLSGTGDLKAAEHQSIKTRFEAWRKLDPGMNRVVLFAASSVDPEGTTWTDGRPAKVVVGRAVALARAACALAEKDDLSLDANSLFYSPLQDFDFVLHLDAGVAGHKSKKNDVRFKNLELASLDDTSLIGFSVATEFVSELRRLYSSAAVFFAGGAERALIAGLWSPLSADRPWKINLAYSTIPLKGGSESETQATANKAAMLAEMARLGGDLVDRVEVHRP